MVIMVTGGARSGKSLFAESYASCLGAEGICVATAQAADETMRRDAERMRARRAASPFSWTTKEEPLHLVELIRQINLESNIFRAEKRIILVDSLSAWLRNLFAFYGHERAYDAVSSKIDECVDVLKEFQGTIIAVTEETGGRPLREEPSERMYRDLAGMMNQRVAAISAKLFLLTAGIPVELKSRQFRWER